MHHHQLPVGTRHEMVKDVNYNEDGSFRSRTTEPSIKSKANANANDEENEHDNDRTSPSKLQSRKRRQQESLSQSRAKFSVSLTPNEIAESHVRQELTRRHRLSFLLRGMALTLLVCAILTAAARLSDIPQGNLQLRLPLTPVKPKRYRIVVAISPKPSQLRELKPLLASLISKQGSYAPAMVYLVLPRQDQDRKPYLYKIPDFIDKYVDAKKVSILNPNVNFGNATVLYAVMTWEKSAVATRIIAMDACQKPVPSNFVSHLTLQSSKFPDAAIAFQGTKLSSYFRTLNTLQNVEQPVKVDILEGTAIMVQRRFFNVEAFLELAQEAPRSVQRADKFLIAAHLEDQNVDRWVVPNARKQQQQQHTTTPFVEAGRSYYVQCAFYLQQQLGIWRSLRFHNYKRLSDGEKDAISCAAGNLQLCRPDFDEVLQALDQKAAPRSLNADR